ncbi:hypothetical protein MG293_006266 [Ovis ammon polii]|uniref:Uncharacterized protein n=1 Tax=Ovis ammon polii TaxID=230172 RepID=A0AAD4UF55_OVIAM|nr:hypothetical protein MG293_006266 [Ovis ammon polii]
MKVKSGDSVISQQKCAKVQRAVYLGTTCLPASHKPGAALICRPLSTGLDSGAWTLGSQRERRIHRTRFPAPPEEHFVHSASSFRYFYLGAGHCSDLSDQSAFGLFQRIAS